MNVKRNQDLSELESQAAQLSGHFERFMIHIVQMQESTIGGELSDLSKQEGNVIYILGKGGASIMRELADNLRLHVSTMTGIVDKLIEKELVSRERSEEDRRIVRISLTAKGERAYQQEHQKRAAMTLGILQSLNADERETLLQLFAKVADTLDKNVVI